MEKSANLATGFGTVATGIQATPPQNVWTDAPPVMADGFYRVKLAQ